MGNLFKKSIIEYDSFDVCHVRFDEPTIIRFRKFRTKLTDSYKGSVWGNKRYERKWGVEIYDPNEDPNHGQIRGEGSYFREIHDGQIYEFKTTSTKIFKNKWEAKKFLKTMKCSPFVDIKLLKEAKEREAKKNSPKKKKEPKNLLEYRVEGDNVIVSGKGTFSAKEYLKEFGMTWDYDNYSWAGKVSVEDIESLKDKGFVVKKTI